MYIIAIVKYSSSLIPKSLLDISRKLASLLAILSGHQGKEILSVILSDIRNNTIEENFQTIRIGDKSKTMVLSSNFQSMKMQMFVP